MSTIPSAARRPKPIVTAASTSTPPKEIPGSSAAATEPRKKDKLVLNNNLEKSRSPYVRAHASNPVHWQIWSPETLALAKEHNRVVFVSIGYAACHWCHVMERESFENEEIAKLLNEHFIPMKVDREERPDIDRVYMNFVQATTGSGGWPLNVFLTPDLEPVFGGTYWPGPSAVRANKDQLGFLEVLEKITQTWKDQQDKFLASAKEILPRLRDFTDEGLKGHGDGPEETLEVDLLEEAYQQFVTRYDPQFGGFGLPPKFPVPAKLAFLLRLGTFPPTVRDIVGDRECEVAKQMVVTTLTNMAKGGIHDQIGHGFARYSVTADWSLPHFEKMLYDNTQLLSVYLDAWLVTKHGLFYDTAVSIARYICEDALKSSDGGFFSSEGADSFYRKGESEKRGARALVLVRPPSELTGSVEGAFYVWTRREFDAILGAQEASICARYWNVHRDGNVDPEDDAHDEFLHQNVLSVAASTEQLSQTYGIKREEIERIIDKGRQKLLEHRNKERPRPNLDDKVVTSWNGLAITALSRAASILNVVEPAVAEMCRENAKRAAGFIKKRLYDDASGNLRRVYREGTGETGGFADDYAYMISGLINLYEATFDASYLKWAEALQKRQIALFWDEENGGFFSTEEGAADMILRLKDGLDSQEPSTNGVSASNLFRLSTVLGDEDYAKYARKTCSAFSAEILEHPSMFTSLMASIVASSLGMRSIVLAGKRDDPEIVAQLNNIRSRLFTNTTVACLHPEGTDKWLLDRNPIFRESLKQVEKSDGKPFVQVCEGSKCLDAFDLSGLEKVLDGLG